MDGGVFTLDLLEEFCQDGIFNVPYGRVGETQLQQCNFWPGNAWLWQRNRANPVLPTIADDMVDSTSCHHRCTAG